MNVVARPKKPKPRPKPRVIRQPGKFTSRSPSYGASLPLRLSGGVGSHHGRHTHHKFFGHHHPLETVGTTKSTGTTTEQRKITGAQGPNRVVPRNAGIGWNSASAWAL